MSDVNNAVGSIVPLALGLYTLKLAGDVIHDSQKKIREPAEHPLSLKHHAKKHMPHEQHYNIKAPVKKGKSIWWD